MATLNNNQVASILNTAIAMSTGSSDVGQLDLRGIIDNGNDSSVIGSVEQFTKALINVVVRNWFTDSSYRSQYSDPFFEDTERYGAIVQAISVEVPEVKESSAWQNFGSGAGQVSTVGQYTIYMPIVSTKYYGKTVSWELPICVTGEQWNTAFKGEDEIKGFVAYILMCVDNALVEHMENMNNMNRNNFMAEKIDYARLGTAHGLHVYDFVENYVKEMGDPTQDFSIEQFLADKKALLFASEKIRTFKQYFKRMSTNFNTEGKKRFTPEDRMVLQVLTAFEERLNTVALSDTYHNDIVAMPLYQSVAYWQGQGSDNKAYDFDEVSSINVKMAADGTEISQSGIVAFLCDKWAILHTIKSRRVAAKEFEPEDLVQYYYQFNDMYMNNLTMNALIFVLKDYTAPVEGGEG